MKTMSGRYYIKTKFCPEIKKISPRYKVQINRKKLIIHILKEIINSRWKLKIALSRPCIYGVFSRVVGGLLPIEEKCVGCLRCNIEYPDIARVHLNNKRWNNFTKILKPDEIETLLYEARTGMVPVKGAGYRGEFGGKGWDGMWTDMSEIVRPTRDGIYGREYISTCVDIGYRPKFFQKDKKSEIKFISVQVPFIFDLLPENNYSDLVEEIMVKSACSIGTFAIIPYSKAIKFKERSNIIPYVDHKGINLMQNKEDFPLIEIDYKCEKEIKLMQKDSNILISLRVPYNEDLMHWYKRGIRIFHLICNYDGYMNDKFVKDLIIKIHKELVEKKIREEITLIGGGGIMLAEHLPKAIICGLDLCSLDVGLWIALQAELKDYNFRNGKLEIKFPRNINLRWGMQRIMNLSNSWRDQLLEILGAMGLREVRRLRGEMGRSMFQSDLEAEAFGDIENFRKDRNNYV